MKLPDDCCKLEATPAAFLKWFPFFFIFFLVFSGLCLMSSRQMLASDVTLHSWGCWVNKHISARFLSPCWHSCPPFQYIKFEVRVWMIPLSSVLFGIKISSHADKSSSSFSWVERLWYILSWISLVKYLRNRAYEKEYFPKWGKISAIWDNKEFSWVHCVHLFSLSVISSKEGAHQCGLEL